MNKDRYGLKFDEPAPEHWVFGAFGGAPMEVLQPNRDWTEFLPEKEYQNLNGIEPFACVTFTVLNAVEALIKRKYGIERNYSDRFLAAISGTKEGGNSPQKVCETLRNKGVAMQEAWPFNDGITTFEKFYEEIPSALISLAEEFNKEWIFKHEFVTPNHTAITSALECSPLLISVAAWHNNGRLYYRPTGMQDNHATTLVRQTDGISRTVFDSYADDEGDPSFKDYEWDDIPVVVKRFWIEEREPSDEKPMSFLQRFFCRKPYANA